MLLSDFIYAKTQELKEIYKNVELYKAINVQLGKNLVSENYLSTETELYKSVVEVDLSEIEEKSSIPYKENGSKVVFKVIPPRKRKSINKEYYLLWTT